MRSSILFLLVCIFSFAIVPSEALFGAGNKIKEATDADTVDVNDSDALVGTLLAVANQDSKQQQVLSPQVAIDLALLLQTAAKDDKTREMINKMRKDEASTLQQLKQTSTRQDCVIGMAQVLSEMQALEVLFESQEPHRALQLMQEEGMVDPSRLADYQVNPRLLEEDTRRGLYFSFCTLAVTAGFL